MLSDIERYVNWQINQSLAYVRKAQKPDDIIAKIETEESSQDQEQNTFRFTALGKAANLICTLLCDIGIQTQVDLPSNHESITCSLYVHTSAQSYKYTAPWYVDVWKATSEADESVICLLGLLNQVSQSNDGNVIFRGEQDLYPSVRSKLARHWNINEPHALKILDDHIFRECLNYVPGHFPHTIPSDKWEHAKIHTMAQVQHKGGFTNLIDFSTDIWGCTFLCMYRVPIKRHGSSQAKWDWKNLGVQTVGMHATT